jgi:hypothetical protein
VNASRHRLIIRACTDGAYDSPKTYSLLKRMSINPITKSRRNAKVNSGPPERRRSVMTLKTLVEKK